MLHRIRSLGDAKGYLIAQCLACMEHVHQPPLTLSERHSTERCDAFLRPTYAQTSAQVQNRPFHGVWQIAASGRIGPILVRHDSARQLFIDSHAQWPILDAHPQARGGFRRLSTMISAGCTVPPGSELPDAEGGLHYCPTFNGLARYHNCAVLSAMNRRYLLSMITRYLLAPFALNSVQSQPLFLWHAHCLCHHRPPINHQLGVRHELVPPIH